MISSIENPYFNILYNNVRFYGKNRPIAYICKLFRINPVNYDSGIGNGKTESYQFDD